MKRNWLRNLALWCTGLVLAAAAQAQATNMLFVTTQDDPLPPPGVAGTLGAEAIANARAAPR